MILADTSVWIDHFRSEDLYLASLLDRNEILIHPMAIGELACGNVGNRTEVMRLLRRLPRILVATHDEVLFLIERHRFMGRGIGFIDAHLLASAAMSSPTQLWSKDRRMMELANELGVAHGPSRPQHLDSSGCPVN